jgi:hypothetical protein
VSNQFEKVTKLVQKSVLLRVNNGLETAEAEELLTEEELPT